MQRGLQFLFDILQCSVSLFRFTDELQTRLETLLEKQKTDSLSDAEAADWAGITDLSRTFTFINAQLAASPATV
jgi:hypothetical protein